MYLNKRLRKYHIDIRYTTKAYFSAYERILRYNRMREIIRRVLSFISIAIGIVVLSGLLDQLDGSQNYNLLLVATCLSIFSILISIYTIALPDLQNPSEYQNRAESFNFLDKHLMTLEAQIQDNRNNKDVLDIVLEVQEKYKILATNPLQLKKTDYKKAKKSLEEGQSSYTEEDFKIIE